MPRPSFPHRIKRLICSMSCRERATIQINQTQIENPHNPFQVFISHRGVDTKRNLAVLLHNNLMKHNINTFLDFKSMKPGVKLFETINSTISECKIGVVIFSPRYCESWYCMHELALLVEMKKILIPVFCNVGSKQLQITDNGNFYDDKDAARFPSALEKAKNIVGIQFNTSNGDWLQLIEDISAAVIENLSDVGKTLEKK